MPFRLPLYNEAEEAVGWSEVAADGAETLTFEAGWTDEWHRQQLQHREREQQQRQQQQQQVPQQQQQEIRKLWAESWREEMQMRKEDEQRRKQDPKLWERQKAKADAEAEKNWVQQKTELKKQEDAWKKDEREDPDRYWYRSGCGDADFSGGN
ncbi:hypothetical protein GPALN_009736 [Globodera pallida]|uniref:SH3 domain-containing protein n=1 Tax=Globodera pallida TaxID=36090 RepID=A0A183BUU8_GLOPA|nr:hypothetical protein GPALN_009736 [Globodera pallida]